MKRLSLATLLIALPLAGSASAASPKLKKMWAELLDRAAVPEANYQPPGGQVPSPQMGSFVQPYQALDGVEDPRKVGTYDTVSSKCSGLLTYEDTETDVSYSRLVSMSSGVTASLGLPLPQLNTTASGNYNRAGVAGMDYTITKKTIVTGGVEELTKCCVQNPSQCTEEFINEWWYGSGKIWGVQNTTGGVKLAMSQLEMGGSIDFSTEKGFNIQKTWNDGYFAYRTQRIRKQSCEEYLNSQNTPNTHVTFTGVSELLLSESKARQNARDDVFAQVVRFLGTEYQIKGDRAISTAKGQVSGVFEDFICVDKVEGPQPTYVSRVRMTVEKSRLDSAMSELVSKTGN